MTDEEKLKGCGNDQRILAAAVDEIIALGCPGAEGELAAWFEANLSDGGDRPLEAVHETLKCRMRVLGQDASADWEAKAVAALEANPASSLSVWLTIKVHKTLAKANLGDAFKAKAREAFPLATYYSE